MREVLTEPESAASSSRLYCPAPVRSRCSPHGTRIRSFGFEFQGPCSAFTTWRARICDPKTFSLAAHNQELVLRHMTFSLQQIFQIGLEPSHRKISLPRQADHLHRCSATSILPLPLLWSILHHPRGPECPKDVRPAGRVFAVSGLERVRATRRVRVP